MVYYPESKSHIRDNDKIVLDLTVYATKRGLGYATRIDTSDLAPE